MTFACLKKPIVSKRTVETRLSAMGYALRPAGVGPTAGFDIVSTNDNRVVWVNSSLDEIANLKDSLLGSLRRSAFR